MNKKDILWQNLLDEEKRRLSSLPPEDLRSMKSFTASVIKKDETTIQYGIWHEIHKEHAERDTRTLSAQLDQALKIPETQCVTHTFVLQASRNIFLGLHRKYLAGFSIDNTGKIIPV